MAWSLTQAKHNSGWSESGFYLTWENHWSVTEQTPDSSHPGQIKLKVVCVTDSYTCSIPEYYNTAKDTISYNGTTVTINTASWSMVSGQKPNYTKYVYVPISWSGKKVTFYIGWVTKTVTFGAVGDFASTISASNGTIGSSIPITLTTKVSGVTHDLSVSVGGKTETLLANRPAASAIWSPTTAEWAQYITGSNSATATITCITHFGTATMSSTKTITVSLVASDVAPTTTSGWVNVTYYNPPPSSTGEPSASNISAFVQGYSKAKAIFTKSEITYSDGASLSKYRVSYNGTDYESTSEDGVVNILTDILTGTSASVVCTVIDSRGNSASETFSINVNAYSNPVLTGIEIFRCAQNGTKSEDGTYIAVRATANISPIDLSGSALNSYNISAWTKVASATEYSENTDGISSGSTVVLSSNIQDPFSPDLSYDVRLVITDGLNNTTNSDQRLITRVWAMKFRENGLGVGFGKAPEVGNAIEVPNTWNIRFGDNIFHPSILGAAENGNTAANNHFNGDYFVWNHFNEDDSVWNGDLVRASSNISVGDPIGALVTTTDVASALNNIIAAIGNTVGLISSLYTDGTATGTNITWYYRKWNNGRVEAWGTYAANIAITTAGYGMYRSAEISIPIPTEIGLNDANYWITGNKAYANAAEIMSIYPYSTALAKMYFRDYYSETIYCKVNVYLSGTYTLPADANANPS